MMFGMYCDLFIMSFACLNRGKISNHKILLNGAQKSFDLKKMKYLGDFSRYGTRNSFYEILIHLIMYVFHYNHFNFTFLCHTCPWSYCRSGEDITTNVPYMTYDVALKLSKKDLVFRPLITYYAMRTLQLVFIEVQVSWNRTKFGRFKNYIDI